MAVFNSFGLRVAFRTNSIENDQLLWPTRPKLHTLEHLTLDQALFRGNPKYYACYIDEDMIGRTKSI